jgi:hypothetical protein
MDSMTKDEPHPFKRLVPGHPYCVEGLRPWESGISCGRYKDDPIHQAEHDRIRKEAFAAVRVSANTPAGARRVAAARATAHAQAITEDTRRLVVTVAKNAESSTTLAIIERLRDRAHAEALAEDDARSVAEGRKLLGWDETPEERERRMTAEFIEAMNTPAEARRAAALAAVDDLRRLTTGLAAMGLPDLSDYLDIIEQALRAGGAA